MTIPTVSIDETSPAGGSNLNLGDNRIREYKTQNREILEIDHNYPSSGQDADAGKHKKVSLIEQADLGSGSTGYAFVGGQTVGGKPELVYTDEDDNDVQVTSGGDVCGLGSGQAWRTNDMLWSLNASTPTGWSDGSTTYNDKFFRVSTGTAGDTGGSDTHDHGAATGAHTLTIDEIPAHTHNYLHNGNTVGASPGGDGTQTLDSTATSSAGGGGSHTHTISSANNIPAFVKCKLYLKT